MSVSPIILGHEGEWQYFISFPLFFFFFFGSTEKMCVIVALIGVTLPSSLSSSASTPVLSVNSFTLTAGRGCVVVKSPWVPQLKDTTKDTPEVSFHNSGRAERLTGKYSLQQHWLSFNHAKILKLHRNWLFFLPFWQFRGNSSPDHLHYSEFVN